MPSRKDLNPPHPQARVATVIKEALKTKGMTLKKLSELTGITLKNLENLSAGNFDALPPRPYVRNYLLAIGDILGFDGAVLWEEIKRDELVSSSGIEDRLPPNRFARRSWGKTLWLSAAGIVLIVYLVVSLPRILGKPDLEVVFPPADIMTIHNSPLLVEGRVTNGDTVTINGQAVPITGAEWKGEVALEPGLNPIRISSQKFLGQEVSVDRQVIYEPILEKGPAIIVPSSSVTSSVSSSPVQ